MTIDSDTIEELALAPAKARTDEGAIEERPIDDLIKADRHVSEKSSTSAVPWGCSIAIAKPGGTLGRR